MKPTLFLITCLLGLAIFAIPVHLHAQEPTSPDGQKVAFLGDSITQLGTNLHFGYARLVEIAFQQQGRPIVMIPAGISGHKSNDMLARFQTDVLDKSPDWMTLSCGVNDVWHGATGVPLDEYKKNITSMVDQATAAGIKVMILTSTMIGEDQPNENNQKLIAYNDFLRDLAKERNLPLADLNAQMQAEIQATREKLQAPQPGNLLTGDGVHPNGLGHEMMAAGVLKAFGFTDAQIAQARAAWMMLPGSMSEGVSVELTAEEYLHLREIADAQKMTVHEMLNQMLQKDLQPMLKK